MSGQSPLRLWPGVVLAILQFVILLGAPAIMPDAELPIGLMGAMACAVAIPIWWLLFSRAPWFERLSAIAAMALAMLVLTQIAHFSIVGAGQGRLLYVLPPFFMGPALVLWAVLTQRLQPAARRAALVVIMLLAIAPMALVRTAGIRSDSLREIHWRWTPTPEELLLARGDDAPGPLPPAPAPVETPAVIAPPSVSPASPAGAAPTPKSGPAALPTAKPVETAPIAAATGLAMSEPTNTRVEWLATSERSIERVEWPGFRGPHRDGVIRGVQIKTDWSASPPIELWRRPIGPGWSSFAVHGDLIYTQEQRGDDEIVACYRLSTGEPVWRHRDAARFWESNGGPGPRATPTLSGGRVYTLGATGILNSLDARTGALAWTRNAATDTGKAVPDWGIASSPVVIDGVVIAAVSGQLIAYDATNGQQRWVGESGGAGYSSPHLATIDGVSQVLLIRGARIISVSPSDGKLLWQHSPGVPAASIVQPAFAENGDVLVATGDVMGGNGIRRLAVARGPSGWTVEERWSSRGLKPYFSDFAVHKGHAYGFDGAIMSCINLESGDRKWKGGRYGNGQLLVLADQDLLLVTSEEGELVLVSATPDKFSEVTRFKAFEGKTWNHPVLIGDLLLVRNGEEMAAYRLSMTSPTY